MTKVDCSRVYVDTSKFSTPSHSFDGAFAKTDIKKGELVEKGIVRRLNNFDGMKNPYVHTWSDDTPNTTWAISSGCATYYNTAPQGKANTHMKRFYDEDRFEIYAMKDIKMDEELTHTYKSLEWREVFTDLNSELNKKSL
jgi:hypothetical protein